MPRRRLLLVVMLVAILCAQLNPAQADAQLLFFPETGQTITDEMYQYWQATPHPLQTLGYPISRPFLQASVTEPATFLRVQYFERAVLEEHPGADQHMLILGRLLGDELVADRRSEEPFQPVAQPASVANWDAVTQHALVDTPAPFKSFYAQQGGLPIFGRPISEQFLERNADTGATYWVQYFERQRLEWHPDAEPLFQVMLGRLGDEYRLAHPDQIDPTAFTASNSTPSVPAHLVYGVNAALFYTDHARVLGLAQAAGFGWIRQQVRWRDLQGSLDHRLAWNELDVVVAAAQQEGLKLLLSIDQAPDWATGVPGTSGLPDRAHYADYAAFVGAMAQRYQGRVQAYEIWNEVNLGIEDAPQAIPMPSDYVDLLAQSYVTIKAADPQALVISGPLAPTEWSGDPHVAISDIVYYKALFADQRFWDHLDVVGVHLFGCSNPPDTLWPAQPGPGPGWTNSREFYFRYLEDMRQLVVDSGHGNRQIWVTEFGWATTNTTPGHEFGNNVSFDQQAAYLVRALELGRSQYTPWLGALFVWNLNFAVTWSAAGNPLHQMASYGILNGDWSPRPAYTAIEQLLKQ
ncbi:MAG: cellulase family glycosylhydrolase [Herpetosiphonaceae bacterium]|nr:cellulase family glycosylhydrolase [Herpetosiphonaceae bacterium]